MILQDFGIIIACCDHDYLFAKGCCASIRYFLGDVPICLIIDGTFSVSRLEKIYGVKSINYKAIASQVLKKRSLGFGLTKMIAFWESPWKHFLYLDADAIVWGNILKFANYSDFDVIIDIPTNEFSDEDICTYCFDIQGIEKHFPKFNWQAYRKYYFCTGAFFATRGIFSLDEYLDILDLNAQEPNLFHMGEQGFLNFMLCRAADEDRIRLGQENIQLTVPDFDQFYLRKRFPIEQTKPAHLNENIVIHWCGPNKPTMGSSQTYSEPMTFSRRKFISDTFNYGVLRTDILLKVEDFQSHLLRYKNKIRNRLRSLPSHLLG